MQKACLENQFNLDRRRKLIFLFLEMQMVRSVQKLIRSFNRFMFESVLLRTKMVLYNMLLNIIPKT